MFDALYCISLIRLKERRKRVKEILSKLNIFPQFLVDAVDGQDYEQSDFHKENIFEYENWALPDHECNLNFNTIPLQTVTMNLLEKRIIQSNEKNEDSLYIPYWNRDVTKGELGCSLSHVLIWQHAIKNKFDTILILEDDIYLNWEDLKNGLNIFENFARRNNYDVFYLGGQSLKDGEDIDENVSRTLFMYCTHAYILTSNAMNILLKSNYLSNMIVIDEFLSSFFMPHPREDIRNLYHHERFLDAFQLKKHVIFQDDSGGSQTEPSRKSTKDVIERNKEFI